MSEDPITLQSDKLDLDRVLRAARQVSERVQSLSANLGASADSLLFYTRGRVKSRSSIYGKEFKKRRGGNIYSYRNMTDLVGYRIVTLYPNQLNLAMNHISALLTAGQSLQQPIFEPGPLVHNLKEVIFFGADLDRYYRNCAEIFKDILKKDWLKHSSAEENLNHNNIEKYVDDFIKITGNEKGYYSSAHFIVYATCYIDDVLIRLPIEVQVRTALEDIWSEVNHERLYKVKSDTAWTYEYEKLYYETESLSDDLKTHISFGLEKISSFSEKSLETINERKKLVSGRLNRDDQVVPDASEKVFDISFIGYLIFILGNPFREYFQQLYVDFAAEIEGLRVSEFVSNDVLVKLDEARSSLVLASIALDNLAEVHAPNSAEAMLIMERQRLLGLELARLEIVALMWCGAVLDGDEFRFASLESTAEGTAGQATDSSETDDNEVTLIAKRMYHELCLIMSDPNALVQPVTMIGFWKSVIAAVFDEELAWEEIQNCYHRYKSGDDECLSADSVYHCLVRTEFAELTLWRAIDFAVPLNLDLLRAGRLPAKRDALFDRLRSSFFVSFEAYELARGHEQGQGDLTFGFSSSLRFRCMDLCLTSLLTVDGSLGFPIVAPLVEQYEDEILTMVDDAKGASKLDLAQYGIDEVQFRSNCASVTAIVHRAKAEKEKRIERKANEK